MRVGIPQGLFYHYYYPLWKTFFTDLGVEVIVSSPTNKRTIDMGIAAAVDEACFPVKVFMGHVRELCSCRLDYIFVPRLVSVEEKSYICPKFMGIPDMVRALIPDAPPLIDITIDLSRNESLLRKEMAKLGLLFSKNRASVLQAYQHGRQELRFCYELVREGYTLAESVQIWEGGHPLNPNKGDLRIGLLGHGYAIYDEGISMNMVGRLRELGCVVIPSEALISRLVEEAASAVPKRVFWTLGRKMLGSALQMDAGSDVDGIIYAACFACGPDSIIGEIIERKVKNKPFMFLTLDEHTGEAGLVTRLEAFCDMLRRRRAASNENNFPAYG